MSAFSLDMATISPAGEILARFKDATKARPKLIQSNAQSDSTEKTLEYIQEQLSLVAEMEIIGTYELFYHIDGNMRAKAWKLFLGCPTDVSKELYSSICQDEPKLFDTKIKDDAFRTFKGNADFWGKVTEDSIVRVLNALSFDFGYVQGMNVLLGPFLYVMSEVDSYFCMKALLSHHIPRYVLKNLDGAHDGAKLFSKCLRIVDPKLFTHISSKIPDLSIFSLRYVLTLFANAQPLSEVLKLWDAIFAIGPQFNILLLCSNLMSMRDSLLKEKRGAKIMSLLDDAPVVSSSTIDGAFALMRFIPAPLYVEMTSHAVSRTTMTTPVDTPRSNTKLFSGSMSTASLHSAESAGNSLSASSSGDAESANSSSRSIDVRAAKGKPSGTNGVAAVVTAAAALLEETDVDSKTDSPSSPVLDN